MRNHGELRDLTDRAMSFPLCGVYTFDSSNRRRRLGVVRVWLLRWIPGNILPGPRSGHPDGTG